MEGVYGDQPLEGFVLALTPFNFTSIVGNLRTAPALRVYVYPESEHDEALVLCDRTSPHALTGSGGRPRARRLRSGF